MGEFSSQLPRSWSQKPKSLIFLPRKEWQGEILETEPAQLTLSVVRVAHNAFMFGICIYHHSFSLGILCHILVFKPCRLSR